MGDHLVVAYHGRPSSRWAVGWAAVEAVRRRQEVRVVVVADAARLAACRPAELVRRWNEVRRRAEALTVEAARTARAAAPDVTVELAVHVGSEVSALVGASHDATLVVLGTGRGHAQTARRRRATVQTVAAHARCPVVLVGAPNAPHPGAGCRVVVGVDGSDRALAALDAAAAYADRTEAPLHVVAVRPRSSAADAGTAHRVAEAAADRARREHPDLCVIAQVLSGRPAALLRLGRTAGLLVLGRQGRGAAESLVLGSVGRAAVRALPCPVAVVGPPVAQGASASSSTSRTTATGQAAS